MPALHLPLQATALRYFLEVARCGSLALASQRLHVAGSAISRQIAGLEETLGVPLFERQPRGMVPTAAGELLAAHARNASLDAERTVQEIQALQGLRAGKVRVVTTEGFAYQFLPPLIVAFREQHEHVRFDVTVATPQEVPERLREGEADVGLTFARAAARDIRVEYRQSAPVLALMRPDHPLARARALTLARLAGYPLALPPADTTLRQMIDAACNRQQLVLEPVLSSNSMAVLHGFVQGGGGVSLTGEVSVRELVARGTVTVVPVRDRGMDLRDIELQTLAGRTLPQAAQRFLVFLKGHLPRPGRPGR